MEKKLDLAWETQELTPALLMGKDAKRLYDALPIQARVGLRYDEGSQSVIGSTSIASVVLDVEAQKYGARTPNLRDLSRPEIMRNAKDRFYIDSRNLVARSRTDPNYERNNPLLKQIYELSEERLGSIKEGFMIEGFTFVPDETDKTGYGLKIVPLDDFRVIQDDRLIGHNRDTFSEVDDLGLPLFDGEGSRGWYARDGGLSGLFLYKCLDLSSNYGNLTYSDDGGRVVLLG